MRTTAFMLAGELSAATSLEDNTFFADVRILVRNRLNRLTAHLKKGTTPSNAAACLAHVVERTCKYGKPFENIIGAEFAQGIDKTEAPGMHCSIPAVRRAVNALVADGLLVRIRTDYGKMCFYGLNIPTIIERISCFYDQTTPKGPTQIQQHARFARVREICNRLHFYYDQIRSIISENLYGFHKQIKELARRAMKNLAESIKGAQREAQDTRDRKRSARASKYGMAGAGGMDFWNAQVEARKERWPHFRATSTKREHGMMTNYVKELQEQDGLETVRQIQIHLEDIIEFWPSQRTFTSVKTSGARRVPTEPSFEFFYAHRREMMPMVYSVQTALERADLETLDRHDYGDAGADDPLVI